MCVKLLPSFEPGIWTKTTKNLYYNYKYYNDCDIAIKNNRSQMYD